MVQVLGIDSYTICDCGAVTITFGRNQTVNCAKENMKKYLGFSFEELEEYAKNNDVDRYEDFYCCDHCVNHYGVDLCGCGSGEEFGKCENGMEECKHPIQSTDGQIKVGEGSWI